MKVLIIGGSGMIGRSVVAALQSVAGYVTVPTRQLANARDLQVYPNVTVVQADVHDDAVLAHLVHDRDVVINLVGILHSRRGNPYGPDFERVHVGLVRRVAQACVDAGVSRLVHLSALGASLDGSSEYLRSKAAGEKELWQICDASASCQATVYQPSVVFGPEDRFLNLFADLARRLPFILLAGGNARMQPVYVGDVAQAIVRGIERYDMQGRTLQLAGPTVYTLTELVQLAMRFSGHKRPIIQLSPKAGRMLAGLMECLPGTPLMSRDNLDSLRTDNVLTEESGQSILGFAPTVLEDVAAAYLRRRS